MTDFQIQKPTMHSGQLRVFNEHRRHNVLIAGRRWHKSTHTLFNHALPGALNGGRWIFCSPTYDQVRIAYDELQRGCGPAASFNSSRMSAIFPSGGSVLFRSLDLPDNLRGHTADGLIIDEAGDVEERAWSEIAQPTLLSTLGESWLVGTPRGRNWLYREFMRVTDTAKPVENAMAWQIPSLGVRLTPTGIVREPHPYENPDLDFAYMQTMYSTMTEMKFQQEILAAFVDDAGGVFRGVMACATAPFPVTPYRGSFVIGCDWAMSHDFTVFVCIDVKKRQVVDFDRFQQIDWHVQRRKLHDMYSRWKQHGSSVSVVAESNSIGNVIISELQRGDKAQGLSPIPVRGFETNQQSKQEIIERLQMFVENRRLTYPNIPALVNELQAYEAERLPVSNRMRYGAPDGEHDDCVMALAIACEGLGEAWPIDTIDGMPYRTGHIDTDADGLAAL